MFDPYRKWLGIPPKDQPPNHYRLLGLELFESDLDVIEGAADRQMGFVRQYQSGEHAAEAAKILNELAMARLCLLKPATKAAYDAKLRQELAPGEPDFPVGPLSYSDVAPDKRPRAKKSKTARSRSTVSPNLMIAGGASTVVCLLLLVYVFTRGGKKATPRKPDKTAETTVAKSGSVKEAVAPAKSAPSVVPPSSGTGQWTETLPVTEPAGEAIDLLKLVDLNRDVALGDWKQAGKVLIGGFHSRLYLPVKMPEDYRLKLSIRELEGADTLMIGFMMAGRPGMIAIDGWNATFSGLYVDRREPSDNCTTWRGRLFKDGISQIVLTVHPGHLHVSFDGKTIVDWHGDPERLFLHNQYEMACRESPMIAMIRSRYVIESASLVPIKPELPPARLARLDREIEVLPLMDLDRDVQRGVWGINKGTLYSPEGWGKIYLPTLVPEEYTLSTTVEASPNPHGDALTIGLVAGKSYFQFVSTDIATGLDLIDGQRWNENETRLEGPLLKPGVPVRVDCTVTNNAIRVEADGKTLVDWQGDFRRLSMPGDWALADGRRLYLGATRHLKFRDIKIGPLLAPPKPPDHPPVSVGTPLDLLALIDPARDALTGKWEREGKSVRTLADVLRSKLVVPFEPPQEYKLTIQVAREPGGPSNDQAFYVNLPTTGSMAMVAFDGMGKTVSGVALDDGYWNKPHATYLGALIPDGPPQEFVCEVRSTGIKVSNREKTVVDWTGNPNRYLMPPELRTPGRKIGLLSWNSRFRIERLTIEAIEPTSFPAVPPLPSDGKLLPIINVERDSRRGDWKLDADGLMSPNSHSPRLRVPVTPPDKYVLSVTVERRNPGGNDIYFGLIVGGHPCAVSIDGGTGGNETGLERLDDKRFFEGANFTRRKYGSPLLTAGKSAKVRCHVLPDTVVVTCDDKEIVRWHGDPRRLSQEPAYAPPAYSELDRNQLWLGTYQTEFVVHDLELRALSDTEAEQLSKSFSGVFPTTPQLDVPLPMSQASVTPVPNSANVPATQQADLPSKAASNLLPVPKRADVESARTRITKTFAGEYKEAKTLEKMVALATKMQELGNNTQASPVDRFAHFMESRDIQMQIGDLLAAFRIIDAMALIFDLPRFEEQADLLQRLAKKAKNGAQNRYIAIVAWKLAGDAAAAEDYATAKEACQRAVAASRASGDPDLQTRAISQVRYYENLFTEWKGAKDAEQTLAKQPNDDAAHAAKGEYRCWVRKDWVNGLPSLRHSKDSKLVQIVTADLANPVTATEQKRLADLWLEFAKPQKNPVIRASAAERASNWYERAIPELNGAEKTRAEKELEAAYELACGRDFKRMLAQPANGVDLPTGADCGLEARQLTLKTTFDITRSWMLSFQFKQPNLDGGWHQIFFWGDGAPGDDPLWIRTDGSTLSAVIENIVEDRGQGIDYQIPATAVGQWTDLKFVYDAVGGNLELYINHRLIRRDSLAIMPAVDRGMPLFLGGTDATGQRWGGQVRELWLGNIP